MEKILQEVAICEYCGCKSWRGGEGKVTCWECGKEPKEKG